MRWLGVGACVAAMAGCGGAPGPGTGVAGGEGSVSLASAAEQDPACVAGFAGGCACQHCGCAAAGEQFGMCSVGIPEFDVLDDGGCVVLLPEGGTISGTATGDLHFCAGLSAKPQANVANAHPVRDGG